MGPPPLEIEMLCDGHGESQGRNCSLKVLRFWRFRRVLDDLHQPVIDVKTSHNMP
ncbi:hypothetical protein DPMN_089598 [Dreissena polymorpha]|uniref:Uncharacterized protein n=1 Tax=Dreissena polymorpha TaxID=45954 RepID=A0A9D4KXA9_DREPO|nr:hypothetical protein DPMN_089598 [Dreissena polymorpha]